MAENFRQQCHFLASALSCVVAISGCALQSQTAARLELPVVSYQGNDLLVDGIRYPQVPTTSNYVSGNVLLFARAGSTESVMATLVRLGLNSELHKSIAGDWFVVYVPKGFETQWIAAFRVVPGVASADLNHRITPT